MACSTSMRKTTACGAALVILGLIAIFGFGSSMAGGIVFVLGVIVVAAGMVLDRLGEMRRTLDAVRKHTPPRR